MKKNGREGWKGRMESRDGEEELRDGLTGTLERSESHEIYKGNKNWGDWGTERSDDNESKVLSRNGARDRTIYVVKIQDFK